MGKEFVIHRPIAWLTAVSITLFSSCRATTLPPDLKAYDFARAYYVEDGGVVIAPQDGFYSTGGVPTPEGIRIMPGQTFIQFDAGKQIMEAYKLVRLDAAERRAHFHERRYRYEVVKSAAGKNRIVPEEYIDSDDFYLSRFRLLEWFDFAFPYLDIHPGEQYWRTRP